MGIVRKTISISEEQDAWVKSLIASGEFASESEVHRSTLKAVKEWREKRDRLESELMKGLNSGVFEKPGPEIIADIKRKHLGNP